MLKNLPENTRIILFSFAPLVGVIILFFIVGNFGFAKISEVRLNSQKAAKDEAVLLQKLEILNAIDPEIESQVNILTTTLPYSNPALLVTSQIKLVGEETAVILYGLKSGAESTENNLSKIVLNFEVVGSRGSVFEFMKKLQAASPLMLVDKVKISESEEGARAAVALKTYWAKLPTKLPAVTDQINGLTSEEEDLVGEILTFRQPVFAVFSAQPDTGRTDPFLP